MPLPSAPPWTEGCKIYILDLDPIAKKQGWSTLFVLLRIACQLSADLLPTRRYSHVRGEPLIDPPADAATAAAPSASSPLRQEGAQRTSRQPGVDLPLHSMAAQQKPACRALVSAQPLRSLERRAVEDESRALRTAATSLPLCAGT